jgi:sulfate adenylyltransferase subunit 2
MREVVAECERPVMLYSIGKDSGDAAPRHEGVLPARPPFPLRTSTRGGNSAR